MIEVFDIVLILFAHFWADFVFQTRSMGTLKSKSLKWLSLHILTYTTVLTILLFVAEPILMIELGKNFLIFIGLNSLLHFMTDFVSSKRSKYFYSKYEETKNENWINFFWLTIGFDQFIHIMTLMLSYSILN